MGAGVCGPTACLWGVTDDTCDALDIKRIALAPMSSEINDEPGEWGFVCLFSPFADRESKVQSKLKIDKRKKEKQRQKLKLQSK